MPDECRWAETKTEKCEMPVVNKEWKTYFTPSGSQILPVVTVRFAYEKGEGKVMFRKRVIPQETLIQRY